MEKSAIIIKTIIKTVTPLSAFDKNWNAFQAVKKMPSFTHVWLHTSIMIFVTWERLWLDGRMDIQSVKSAWEVLHAELKACIPPTKYGNNKGCRTNTHTSVDKMIIQNGIHFIYITVISHLKDME